MDAFHLRRGTHPIVGNALVYSVVRGLDLDDNETCDSGPYLPISNSMFAGVPPMDSLFDAKRGAGIGNPDTGDPLNCGGGRLAEEAVIQDPGSSNVVIGDTAVSNHLLRAPLDVRLPDFRPIAGSLAATTLGGAPPSTHPVTGQPTKFDVSATYLGAVAPANASGSNIPWYAGWTRGWGSASVP